MYKYLKYKNKYLQLQSGGGEGELETLTQNKELLLQLYEVLDGVLKISSEFYNIEFEKFVKDIDVLNLKQHKDAVCKKITDLIKSKVELDFKSNVELDLKFKVKLKEEHFTLLQRIIFISKEDDLLNVIYDQKSNLDKLKSELDESKSNFKKLVSKKLLELIDKRLTSTEILINRKTRPLKTTP